MQNGYPVDGTKLRAARLAARMTVKELAEAAGCSWSWIYQAERWDKRIGFDLIRRLEDVLGVTARELGIDLPDRVE